LWLTAMLCLAGIGCAGSQDDTWEVPGSINPGEFERDVLPVLLRDCGFHACHGSSERFFRVWGPGRVRLDARAAFDPVAPTALEVRASYERALSFIDRNDPKRSLLLRKGLAPEAGGAGHLGADKFGRNVYRTIDSAGYITLSRWVLSITAN